MGRSFRRNGAATAPVRVAEIWPGKGEKRGYDCGCSFNDKDLQAKLIFP